MLNGVGNFRMELEQGLFAFTLTATVVQNAPESFSKRDLESVAFVLDITGIRGGWHQQSDLVHVLWSSP